MRARRLLAAALLSAVALALLWHAAMTAGAAIASAPSGRRA